MQIRRLTDDREEIKTIARWCFYQWRHLSAGDTLQARIDKVAKRAGSTQVPLTLVAAADTGTPLGTASLVESDMDDHAALTPWLASVYVPPPHRGHGIGMQLCARIVDTARELGYQRCYLFTPDQERWYRRQGWSLLQREPYRGEYVSVMQYALG